VVSAGTASSGHGNYLSCSHLIIEAAQHDVIGHLTAIAGPHGVLAEAVVARIPIPGRRTSPLRAAFAVDDQRSTLTGSNCLYQQLKRAAFRGPVL
jgi:hypothetical protein